MTNTGRIILGGLDDCIKSSTIKLGNGEIRASAQGTTIQFGGEKSQSEKFHFHQGVSTYCFEHSVELQTMLDSNEASPYAEHSKVRENYASGLCGSTYLKMLSQKLEEEKMFLVIVKYDEDRTCFRRNACNDYKYKIYGEFFEEKNKP